MGRRQTEELWSFSLRFFFGGSNAVDYASVWTKGDMRRYKVVCLVCWYDIRTLGKSCTSALFRAQMGSSITHVCITIYRFYYAEND